MSELLRQFLSVYIEWVDGGAPDHEPFSRAEGLCDNLDYFEAAYAVGSFVPYDELGRMFQADGLSRVFPFGVAEFTEHGESRTQHLHQPRIDWVRAKLAA